MRLLSYALFVMAALVGGCAILIYGSDQSRLRLRSGRSQLSSRALDLGSDDRFWLVGLPGSSGRP